MPAGTPDDVEQQFYDALQRGEIEALMAVWGDDDDICCVHPGGSRSVGAAAIRAVFESVFASGGVSVRPERIRRLHTGVCAVHSVIERIRSSSPEGARDAWVVATNVYLLDGDGWRLVAHHASPGSPREVEAEAETAAVLH